MDSRWNVKNRVKVDNKSVLKREKHGTLNVFYMNTKTKKTHCNMLENYKEKHETLHDTSIKYFFFFLLMVLSLLLALFFQFLLVCMVEKIIFVISPTHPQFSIWCECIKTAVCAIAYTAITAMKLIIFTKIKNKIKYHFAVEHKTVVGFGSQKGLFS